MLKNWKKKLIAILLIFTMTFSNFALVGKTYASSVMAGIFGTKSIDPGDTGSSNVEFDAYFKTSQNSKSSKTVRGDINDSELFIGATVKVKNSGYLKDAKILFGNGKELNFKINELVQIPVQTEETEDSVVVQEQESLFEMVQNPEIIEEPEETQYETINVVEENREVQKFENNELYLTQLNANSEMNIEFPISYEYKKFVEEAMISKTNKIKFEGTYVLDDSTEIAVSKTVDLKLSWEDEREIKAYSEITKYIGYS